MSDVRIPGVGAGKYDNLIQSLMKKERIPRDNAAVKVKVYEVQNNALKDVERYARDLRDAVKGLYSFNNPFAEKEAHSSNERAFTVDATRDAAEQNHTLRVKDIAQGDAFLSDPLPEDFRVPSGTYTFCIGEKKICVSWKGGHYRDFIRAVNKQGKDSLTLSEIKTSGASRALLFRSELTGKSNRLSFEDAALDLALRLRVVQEARSDVFTQDVLSVGPGKHARLDFPHPLRAQAGLTLEFVASLEGASIANEESRAHTPAQGGAPTSSHGNTASAAHNQDGAAAVRPTEPANGAPVQEETSSVFFEGVTVKNEASQGDLPTTDGLEKYPAVDDKGDNPRAPGESQGTATHEGSGSSTDNADDTRSTGALAGSGKLALESLQGHALPLPPLVLTQNAPQMVSIPLREYGDVRALILDNAQARGALTLRAIRVRAEDAPGGYVPVNPASQAQDAAFDFDGVHVTRGTNSITDLIPGVTLSLHERTEKTETLSVTPDVNAMKNAIIEFVAKYNRLMAEINIVTSNKSAIIDELAYLTPEEKKKETEQLGSLHGDSTLLMLKDRLRRNTSNAYRAGDDGASRTLAHIGISTKAHASSGINTAQLRGYLEIDEEKLHSSLNAQKDQVRALFGHDSDGDLLVDNGVAFTLTELLNPYLGRSGIFAIRSNGVDERIKSTEKRVETYDKQLEKKERELRHKYHTMDGALRSLQKQSDAIQNFNQSVRNRN